MDWKITETDKYKMLVQNQQSVIELAKVEAMQKQAEELERFNFNFETFMEQINNKLIKLTDKIDSIKEMMK